MNLCDVKTIKDVMAIYGITFRKEFGQNFLTNPAIVEEIADRCTDYPDSTILEIGPGAGVLTQELAFRYPSVVAVEIDRGLIPVLRYTLSDCPEGVVSVVNEDIMKTDIAALLAPAFEKGRVSVCANLPYYITTPILMKLLESGLPFDYITIMIQSEVAARLCAKAGSKDYGAITAVLNYYGKAERLFTVSAGNFMPAPKVASAVVQLSLYKEPRYTPKNEAHFLRTVSAAFAQRRKTLVTALAALGSGLDKEKLTEIVTSLGHSPTVRGERLSTADFVALSDAILDAAE